MGKKIGIAVGAVVIIGLIIGAILYKQSVEKKYLEYEEIIESKDSEIEDLYLTLEEYEYTEDTVGPLTTVYRVVVDKKAGLEFRRSDVEAMEIPESFVIDNDEYIQDLSILDGTIYKVDIRSGMPLCKSLFFREILMQTDRYYDVVVDLFPVNVQTGDYVDLRIVTPNGLDYIVFSKKRIVEFYGEACRFILSEEEIHQYHSALVDTFINAGTYLYVTVYIEPALQKKATIYYPITDKILAQMLIDPNIVQLAEIDLIMRQRSAFEGGLRVDDKELNGLIGGRKAYIGIIQKAAADWNKAHRDDTSGTTNDYGSVDDGADSGDYDFGSYQGIQDAPDAMDGIQDGITGGGW